MSGSRRFACLFLLVLCGISFKARAQDPIEIEPADLAKRQDLIGREVIVDDRVKMFFPINGRYPEIILKRSTVPVMLDANLRYDSAPSARAVRVRGILKMEGNLMVLEATRAPELFRNDIDRLQRAMKTLPPEDPESRSAWGDWASKRAEAFNDADLKVLADQLQAESIAIELRRPSTRSPEAILALAKKARQKKVAEPEPSALTHLALRLKMASAKTKGDYQTVADDALALLPKAKSAANANARLGLEEYLKDPATSYRNADADVRAALDRRLWTDAIAENLRIRATEEPKNLLDLADEAKSKLPDRPAIEGDFRRRHIEASTDNIAQLDEAAMRELVRTYREKLDQPKKADELTRTWLDNRRKNFLGPNNADQRVELAKLYWSLLKEKVTAADLLREALKIDETDSEATDWLQRIGYVKSGNDWRDPTAKPGTGGTPDSAPKGSNDPFLGLTPNEVKSRLGEPKYTSRIATQGRVSIQWIYEGTAGSQYIDFLQRAGEAMPVVVGQFSLR